MTRRSYRLPIPVTLAALIMVLVPTVAASNSLSIDLHWRNEARPDAGQLYVSLVYASAREYFGLSAYRSCAGQYSRPTELITALYLSAETRRPPVTLLKQKKGKGWGRLAKEMGLPANYWAKGHGRGKKGKVEYYEDHEVEREVYLRYLSCYYGVDRPQIEIWLHRGLSNGDLIIGLNLAANTGRPASVFLDLRLRGQAWTEIAVKYHQSPAVLTRAAPPKQRRR